MTQQEITRPEPAPDELKTPLFCLDQPMEGQHIVLFLKDMIRLWGRGTHGISDMQTDNLTDDVGEKVNNDRQYKFRFIFTKLK